MGRNGWLAVWLVIGVVMVRPAAASWMEGVSGSLREGDTRHSSRLESYDDDRDSTDDDAHSYYDKWSHRGDDDDDDEPVPLSVTPMQALHFGIWPVNRAQSIAVPPGDSSAAVFRGSGEPHTIITASVVESRVFLLNPSGGMSGRIAVDGWRYGGDLRHTGASGSATFDAVGKLFNLRIGAVAHILAKNRPGAYSGSATFRVVYQ